MTKYGKPSNFKSIFVGACMPSPYIYRDDVCPTNGSNMAARRWLRA